MLQRCRMKTFSVARCTEELKVQDGTSDSEEQAGELSVGGGAGRRKLRSKNWKRDCARDKGEAT